MKHHVKSQVSNMKFKPHTIYGTKFNGQGEMNKGVMTIGNTIQCKNARKVSPQALRL